ncbi:L,D-transpeptidase [Sporolactobacillus shoreae]|uniref:L,D-transpeptidase n=1 Tax=Sporolactobacillus shoreae TaxID=1465501 RepID=A0A4Z0GNR9_9BACL|nr:L,D-transpeptidase [Sporolactobacillus shoreae]TGA98005.1 L,D-transpeptidase [Sporolactobacillus shoreae]
MNFLKKGGCAFLFVLIAAALAACTPPGFSSGNPSHPQEEAMHQKNAPVAEEKAKEISQSRPTPVNWNKPSGGAYPVLKSGEAIWLDVSVGQQRVYVKDGKRTIYTMLASTGLDNGPDTTTPLGTYHIQAERGTWFYAPQYKEGAEYWVSWKNHGEFLFHSVPMDKNRHVLKADAEKLGSETDSHGCIHLTIPDAKWIYEHIPFNTKVVIHA